MFNSRNLCFQLLGCFHLPGKQFWRRRIKMTDASSIRTAWHRWSVNLTVMVVLLTGSLVQAKAQVVSPGADGPLLGPRDTRPQLPEFTRPEEPGLALPPPPPQRVPRLSQEPALLLRGVRFDGNTVIPEQELARIAADFVGRVVSAEDLQELRYRLTERYVEDGYINSGAVLPDQDVVDGIVTYRIIEGQLSEIAITGNEGLQESYIADRLAIGAGPPLNVNQLRDRIQILLQDPLIRRLNAELRPGAQPGESLLDVAVERERPQEVYLSFDNNVARSIGEYRGRLSTVFRNLTGWGDTVDLLYGRSEGLTEVTGGFALPVNRYDTTVGFRFDYNDAEVVEEALRDLDIASDMNSVEIFLNQPVYQTPEQKLTLELALAREWSETTVLGRPFTFTPGEVDGKSDVTVLRFSQSWVSRSPDQVIAARSSFNFGLNAFGATDNPKGVPDGQFASWLGQFQWARQFGEAGPQLIFRTDMQLTNDALLPIERLSIGGADSVRGYRKNTLIRDSGVVTSLEGRIPIFRLPIPGLSQQAEDGIVQVAPFTDFGYGWNKTGDTYGPPTIYSVGLGLRWQPSPNLQAQIYYGHALRDVDNPERGGLQDNGIYFQLTARLY
jgi:hemolysin activation/secretion protein